MAVFEIHIHQYNDIRQPDGTIRKVCSICGKMK
jgi:hypothetical protein